jgi:hypothetical protein
MTMRISVTSISTNTAVEKYDVVPVDEDSNITVYTRRIDKKNFFFNNKSMHYKIRLFNKHRPAV